MHSAPAVSVPESSGTKSASSSPICVFEDHPSSKVDVVVICSHSTLSPEQQEQQEHCCERLRAAKLPARILTFTYDGREFESWYGEEEAAILYQSLSSEREASGRTKSRIIFISTHRSENWVLSRILFHRCAVRFESPVEGVNVNVHSASIARSTIGTLHFPPSKYTYRQRVLETAVLLLLQYVGVIVLHCSDPLKGCSIGSFLSPLFGIGFTIHMTISNRPDSPIFAFWLGFEAIFWVFRDSPYMRIIESVLRYTTLGFYPFYYSSLAMLQFTVNRHDQLQWLFLGVSIIAVIREHRLSSAEYFASPQTLLFTLPFAITASMVCSACLHCVWRFLSGTRELERKVRSLVKGASKMVPEVFWPFPDRIVENESIFAGLSSGESI